MSRLIIFSYDATEAFKEAYKQRYQCEYEERALWDAINEIPGVDINGKPVKSTLVIDAEYLRDYRKIVELVETQFEGLSYVVGTVAQNKNEEDMYDEDSNPDSDDDYADYLANRQ